MRVFADTYFYLALLNPRDAAYRTAHRGSSGSSIQEVVTTAWVLLELADAMHMPGERTIAASFIADLHAAVNTRIVPASGKLLESGFVPYASRPDKAWSLTDCLSFVVMADERLTQALTGDHHFTQAGYEVLMRE